LPEVLGMLDAGITDNAVDRVIRKRQNVRIVSHDVDTGARRHVYADIGDAHPGQRPQEPIDAQGAEIGDGTTHERSAIGLQDQAAQSQRGIMHQA
jgi:hypothetical protein